MRVWVPRPDQEAVLAFLEPRDRAAVWAPTGAGKTAMAGAWADWLLNDRFSASRLLITAPKLPVQDWASNVGEWEHLARIVQGARVVGFPDLDLTRQPGGGLTFRDKRATKRHLLSLRERVHLCSWDAFPWLMQAYGKNVPYDAWIADESSRLRDQGSEASRAARHLVHRCGASHVLELTATANANSDEAVYSQLDIVQRGLLGDTLTQFRETFCEPASKNWQTGQVYSWKVRDDARAEFERRCASVAITVPDSLGIEVLPVEHWCALSGVQEEAYRAIAKDHVWRGLLCGSEGVVHAKLRQIASGFVYHSDEDSPSIMLSTEKMERLQSLVEELPGQALVAFEWKVELERLRSWFGKHLADIRDPGARDAFMAGKLKLLAVHPASAGHGVDGLQYRTRDILWTTVSQDNELWIQTNGRLKRPGQESSTVRAHVLVTRGTREEEVWTEVLPGKATVADLLRRATLVS